MHTISHRKSKCYQRHSKYSTNKQWHEVSVLRYQSGNVLSNQKTSHINYTLIDTPTKYSHRQRHLRREQQRTPG